MEQEKLNLFQILIIILSVYVLIVLFVDTVWILPEEISNLLSIIDNGICIVFLIDFAVRFSKAEEKIKFMKWGWIDLLSSIPTIDVLRAGRLLRLIRLIRILRAIRSTKLLITHVFKNRKQGTFSAVATISVLLVMFSSITILNVEKDPSSNIKTAEDAIWWSFVTITTVGYGDKFPVTTEGRIIAAILMTAGVGLFGTFTGFIASWFMEDKK
ncbi:MAG: ion transporter [Bacteroidota bacterium]|jgi:voltage-gated potassium channel